MEFDAADAPGDRTETRKGIRSAGALAGVSNHHPALAGGDLIRWLG